MERCKARRNPLAAWTLIEGELMAITPEDSVLHRFNETGSFIWERLDGQQSLAEIAKLLTEEFEVPAAEAEADVAEFVGRMLQDKLIDPASLGEKCRLQG